MNSDNYDFSKSSAPQSASNYSSFADKQWNFINDINGGVYPNTSGLTLVQWDLTSIYNSAGFSDASDLYLAVPIVMCAAVGSATSTANPGQPVAVAAPTAGYGLCTLKSNYQHLIHQLEIVCNGKTVDQMQPFISVVKNFQMLSQLSATDLKSNCVSFGMADTLDNEKSMVFNTVAGGTPCGVGLCNNRPFFNSPSNVPVALVAAQGAAFVPNVPVAVTGTLTQPQASTEQQLYMQVQQNGGTVNGAIQKRISRIVDTSKTNANSFNKIWGNNGANGTQPFIMSAQQLNAEIKPYYTVVGNVMTWYDVGLIPLKHISNFIDNLGLVKKLDIVIRAYFNTGSIQVPIGPQAVGAAIGVTALGTDLYYGAPVNSSFTNICPFTINVLADTTANGGFYYNASSLLNSAYIAAGVFIAKAPVTNIGGANINLALNVAGHSMAAARCYYSQVKLDQQKALTYVQENRQKAIVYQSVLYNQYTNIGAGGTFSNLIQSGIKNPLAVLIVPFISSTCPTTVGGAATLGFSQYASPFDTSPATYAPISLINLSVNLGGVNVLNTSLNYTYENFLSQICTAESLTSSDIGVACGLISSSWWEANRVYYVDLARSRDADKAVARNLNVSFTNNTLIPIDIMIFTIYLDKVTVDIETGVLNR